MGWFEDACAWVDQAVDDVGDAFDAAGQAIEQAASDAIDWVGDAAEDVGQAIVQTVVGVGETIADFGDAVGDTLSGRDPGETWTEFGLNALDNMVFDPVDYLTGGDVNVDYDNGQFTADIDLNLGVGAVGLHVGDAGFDASASFDIGVASGSISLDSSAGFAASGSIGIADGPLPYAEGHLSITPDGGVLIGGELQGSLPMPGGGISFGLDGEAELNPDGSFGVSGSFDTDIDGPFGTGSSFHTDGHLDVDPLDRSFDIGGNVDGEVTGPGGTHLGGQAGFDTSFDDGRLESTVGASIDAGAQGRDLDAGFDATVGLGKGGPSASVDRWADLDVPDASAADGVPDDSIAVATGASAPTSQQALGGSDGLSPLDDPFAADDGGGGGADPSAFAPAADVVVDAPPPVDDAPDVFTQAIDAADQLDDAADDLFGDLGQ